MNRLAGFMFFSGCFLLIALNLTAVEESGSWWLNAQKEADRSGFKILNLAETKKQIALEDNLLLVDVRPSYEFEAGHLPGAVNLEFDLGDRARLTPKRRALFIKLLGADQDRKILVYCRSYT